MRKYRFYLVTRLGTREVFPLGINKLALEYLKENNRSEFVRALKGKMTFGGDDFHLLYSIELTIYRCEFIQLIIKKSCVSEYHDFFTGKIALNSAENWDIDKCMVSLSVAETDKYECFESGKDTEINVFNYISHNRTSNAVSGTIESESFTEIVPEGGTFDEFPGEPNPYAKGWRIKEYSVIPQLPGTSTEYSIKWVREEKASVTQPNGYWILDGAVYARPAVLYNQISTVTYDPNNPNAYGFSYTVLTTQFTNGIGLPNLLECLVNIACPDLKIKSDFFQINPDTVTNVNYATGERSKVLNLVVYQKSDIKRPDNDDATQFNTNLTDMLEDICNTFQLEYEITDDNYFRIEHVSFKNVDGEIGLDVTQEGRSEINFGKRRYKYDNEKIPKKQTFTFMDTLGGDFAGVPIIYSGACVGRSEVKDEAVVVKNISTDIECVLNSTSSERVSDNGFVLVANDIDDSILTQQPIYGGNFLNNTLAWSILHVDYWKYNRAQRTMSMNGVKTTAKTVIPTKLQEKIVTTVCCDDVFDPNLYIKTSLGDNGTLKSATYELFKEQLTMDILFPSDDNLINNAAPIGVADNVDTNKNVAVTIDVLSNDSDPDGNIDPSTLNIVSNGLNGVAIVTVDFKIQYTPNADFVGNDVVVYSVKDNWSEPMLNTPIVISVIEP